MKVLHLKGLAVFEQLKIEEALLRADAGNFCLINEGSAPAIVMGISGKAEELVNAEKMEEKAVPLIRRFSGGGTVIVDEETLFVTFICEKKLHTFALTPEPILKWAEEIFKEVFALEGFRLRENDFVIGEKKCGGNAQYLRKERFCHHTSFLWDFHAPNMEYLLHPKKTPSYRAGRAHLDFLCCLKDHLPSKAECLARLKKELAKRYALQEVELEQLRPLFDAPHRRSTVLIAEEVRP